MYYKELEGGRGPHGPLPGVASASRGDYSDITYRYIIYYNMVGTLYYNSENCVYATRFFLRFFREKTAARHRRFRIPGPSSAFKRPDPKKGLTRALQRYQRRRFTRFS